MSGSCYLVSLVAVDIHVDSDTYRKQQKRERVQKYPKVVFLLGRRTVSEKYFVAFVHRYRCSNVAETISYAMDAIFLEMSEWFNNEHRWIPITSRDSSQNLKLTTCYKVGIPLAFPWHSVGASNRQFYRRGGFRLTAGCSHAGEAADCFHGQGDGKRRHVNFSIFTGFSRTSPKKRSTTVHQWQHVHHAGCFLMVNVNNVNTQYRCGWRMLKELCISWNIMKLYITKF